MEEKTISVLVRSHYGSKCVGDIITVDFKISEVRLDEVFGVQISHWFATYFVVFSSVPSC